MKAQEELAQVSFSSPALVTIGMFDGMHRGHQHLLKRLTSEAKQKGYHSVVVTFRNHPRRVVHPEVPLFNLCPMEERLHLLAQEGANLVVPLTFDRELSLLRPEGFVRLLREAVDLRGLVVGSDFALGHQREGTVPVLTALGREMDFTVQVVSPLKEDGHVVSSTAIRDALVAGDVQLAARMLGRSFVVPGVVSVGEGRGRHLGFPTANLKVDPSLAIPGNGIYATWAVVNGVSRASATSIGVRPTFGPGPRTIETYILDFFGDLYGTELRLEFVARLRDERRFDSVEALVARMREDVAQVRASLG